MSESAAAREWLAGLVTESYGRLYGVALRILRNHHDAEDALGNAMTKALANIHTLEDRGAVHGWLRRIVRNAALDLRRRRIRRPLAGDGVDEVPDPDGTDAIELVGDAEEGQRVLALLPELPEKQRDAFERRVLRDEDYQDIAEALGVTRNYARVLVFRAIDRLRELLG